MKRIRTKSLEIHGVEQNSDLRVNVVDAIVHAGFPIPVDAAYQDQPIDLNKELIHHPATTFIARVVGDSMLDEGVEEGDLLVVDKSIEPDESHLSVCCVDGEFALKRIKKDKEGLLLLSGNPLYKPIRVTPSMDFLVWGVVTWIMKKKY